MKSSFNVLLTILALLDTMFLVMCIWDYSCMKVWGLHLTAYVYLFPYLWYPCKNIILSWTTFLIMAISTERFLAVCRPHVYRSLEASQSPKTRTLSYFVPSLLLSVFLNLPKFLEANLVKVEVHDDNMEVVEIVDYDASELRRDADYIYFYVHWTRYYIYLC